MLRVLMRAKMEPGGVPHPLVAARAEAGSAGRRVDVQARSLLAALVTGAVEI